MTLLLNLLRFLIEITNSEFSGTKSYKLVFFFDILSHDEKKKTIFYENAVIKVYDFPILFLPRLSHPDPSVDRRSGFLVPSFSDSKNLGEGLDISYFWAVDRDKDFTFKNKLFVGPLLKPTLNFKLNLS